MNDNTNNALNNEESGEEPVPQNQHSVQTSHQTHVLVRESKDFWSFFETLRVIKILCMIYTACHVLLYYSTDKSQLASIQSVLLCVVLDISSAIFLLAGFAGSQLWAWMDRIDSERVIMVLMSLEIDILCAALVSVLLTYLNLDYTLNWQSILLTSFEALTALRVADTVISDSWHSLNVPAWLVYSIIWCCVLLNSNSKFFAWIASQFGSMGLQLILFVNLIFLILFEVFAHNNYLFFACVTNLPYRSMQFNIGMLLYVIPENRATIASLSFIVKNNVLILTLIIMVWFGQIDKFGQEPCARAYAFQRCLPPMRPTSLTSFALCMVSLCHCMNTSEDSNYSKKNTSVNDNDDNNNCMYSIDDGMAIDDTSITSADAADTADAYNVDSASHNLQQLQTLTLIATRHVMLQDLPSLCQTWVMILLCWPTSLGLQIILDSSFSKASMDENKAMVAYFSFGALIVISKVYVNHVRGALYAGVVRVINTNIYQSSDSEGPLQTTVPELLMSIKT